MTAIELAEFHWQNDQPLPLDIAAQLMAEGIDVEAAEAAFITSINRPIQL